MSLNLNQIAARTLWVATPKAWLFNEEIAARTKIDGMAAIPPGEKQKPFSYDANPYPFFFIPGRNKKNVSLQFRPDRQRHVGEAQAAFQAEFDKAMSKGQRSSDIFSIEAETRSTTWWRCRTSRIFDECAEHSGPSSASTSWTPHSSALSMWFVASTSTPNSRGR